MQTLQAWMQAQCEALKMKPIGEIELVQERAWSVVYRVPTAQGTLFGKAPAHFAQHETALLAHLTTLSPTHVPHLIAVDHDNGYILIGDAGQRLRETLLQQPDLAHWERLLPQYAQLQQATASDVDILLAKGVPDRRLAQLGDLFVHLIADEQVYVFDGDDTMSDAEYQRLQALVPTIQQKIDAVAQYPIPEAIQHGDLHDGNVFHTDGQYCFIDWGDASLSHPFFSLRTSYVSAEIRFELDEDAPELNRLRDAYLSAWRAYASDTQLQQAFALAQSLWSIGSALTWKNAIDASDAGAYQHVLPSLMREVMAHHI